MDTNSTNGNGQGRAPVRKLERWPQGLWVGRKLRSEEQRAKHGVSPQLPGESRAAWMRRTDGLAEKAGNPLLRAFSASWHWRYRRLRDGVRLPVLGDVMGEQVTTEVQARAFARAEVEAIRLREEAARLSVREDLRRHVSDVREGNWCSLGEYLAGLEAVLKQRDCRQWKRVLSSVRLVVAIGLGWREAADGRHTKWPCEVNARLDAVRVDDALCERVSLAYMLAMQVKAGAAKAGDAGLEIQWGGASPHVVNRTINSTLALAAMAVGKQQRREPLSRLAVPWGVLEGFARARLPVPVKDVGEEVPSPECMAKLEAMAEQLQQGTEGERELALVFELFKTLGLRSGELAMARASWLVCRDGVWFLDLRDRADEGFRMKGIETGFLRLVPGLGEYLHGRCEAARAKFKRVDLVEQNLPESVRAVIDNPFLVLPEVGAGVYQPDTGEVLEHEARRRLIRDSHNAWLKRVIGETRSRKGNHRLRKLCATMLYRSIRDAALARKVGAREAHEGAAEAVRQFIRHKSEATSLLFYIAPEMMRESTAITPDAVAGLASKSAWWQK